MHSQIGGTMKMEDKPRIHREAQTLKAMLQIYCRKQHRETGLCASCQELEDYALSRLEKCPYQEGKTTCANCPVHCYQPQMRERIRKVMRVAGPWMLLYHPILTIKHFWDGRRTEPIRNK